MNPNSRITGLNRLQADGLACVVCAVNYLQAHTLHVPAGWSDTGSQVFACESCQTAASGASPSLGRSRRTFGTGGAR